MCDTQPLVIQTSVPEIFDDVTDDVTWKEWSPALPLMSSKIAFGVIADYDLSGVFYWFEWRFYFLLISPWMKF